MEFLVLVIVVIILIVLVNLNAGINKRLDYFERELMLTRKMLADATAKHITPQETEAEEKKVVYPKTTTTKPADKYWESNFKVEEQKEEARLEKALEEWKPADEVAPKPISSKVEEVEAHTTASFVHATPPPPKPTFFERNPDLEKFIGENLVSKIGIGILVLAIAYFVKFAIDNNWIGVPGRVAIGIICGGILVGLAYKMRNNYKAFSSVLTGGGIAVFYFTIALAYHQFHLFSQSTAFIIMLVITAFAVALSLIYDRQEVAIIALVGGFASPFMVSNGSGNFKTLFIYLIILNTGLLVLAYKKAWRLLNLLAFFFTIILVGGWLFSLPDNEAAATYRSGFMFLTVFYLLFFLINIAHNIKENKKFIASDFGILVANTSLYFAAGLYCLLQMHATEYRGLFSAAMGVFNLAASYLLFRNRKVDTNILYLLTGITLTFVSLTAPLQLQGNFITFFWASECVLLYWLFQKSKISIIGIASVIVWACMIISLAMDWMNFYKDVTLPLNVIINKGFITTLYSSVASYVLFMLNRSNPNPTSNQWMLIPSPILYRIASLLMLYIGGLLEVNHQFLFYYPGSHLNLLYLEAYTFIFVLCLYFISRTRKSLQLSFDLQLILFAACLIVYLLMVNQNFDLQVSALTQHAHQTLFTIGHLGVMLLAGVIISRLINLFRNNETAVHKYSTFFTWSICILIIIYVSVELNLLIRSLFYSSTNPIAELQRIYIKTVLPILWGLCSFAFMWLGMKYKFKPLRIISLALFSLTLIKLFAFDIQNIPVAGKIAAFFCLGVLLLVVSFMYQRLKKIIIEDEQRPSA